MPAQTSYQLNDFTKLFSQFQVPGLSMDKLVAAQRRNFEAMTAAAQLTTESWQTVIRRQVEAFTQFAEEGSSNLRNAFTPDAPENKFAQQADLIKSTFERGVTNLREMSDILAKSNAEATDVIAKRVTESFAELKGAVKKA